VDRIRASFVLGLALGLAPAAASGQGALPAAPPVESLVQEALRRAPAIAAGRADVEAARHREAPAGALPDPTLEVFFQDAGFPDWTVGEEPMSMVGPQVTQGIPFPGKRSAREAAAAAETAVRSEELERLRRDVARDVRRAYARLYELDRELELLAASRDLVDLLAQAASHHVETGDMDQEAVLKVRLLVSRLEESRTDLGAERLAAVAALNRLLDRPGDAPLGVVTALPRGETPPAAFESLVEAASADVAVKEAAVKAAERRARTARVELRPDLLAGAGVGFRGDLAPVASARLGIELPLWQRGKQRPAIRAAEADLDAARHELRDARAAARADAARLRAAWMRAEEQVLRYEQSFVPQTSLAFDAARSAYLGRRGDFSTVIEDFHAWLEARRGLARREAERFDTWAEIDALLRPAPDAPALPGEAE
jgi:outer membrane protein TolC